MSRRFVQQLSPGDAVDEVYLVVAKQVRYNRVGQPYLSLDLRDRTGTINARLWNAGEQTAQLVPEGGYLRTKGKVNLHQGQVQLILSNFEAVDAGEVSADDFIPRTPHEVESLLGRLSSLLKKVDDPALRTLGECLLMDRELLAKFTLAPAGIRHHHAYQGGLLEHVVTLMTLVDRVADLYPMVDRDLLMLGAMWHDVGKVVELSYERGFAYTDEGQLVGHLVIGVEILSAKAKEAEGLLGEPFPPELLMRLKHMVVSHHGPPEHGSPKAPMTLEAMALHYLDNLDAQLHAAAREIREDIATDSAWTPYNANLGRRLYKGLPTGEANTPGED